MKTMALLLSLLIPSLAWSDCPVVNGEWLLEFSLEYQGPLPFDWHYSGYLTFYDNDTAGYSYGYADADRPDDIGFTFGLGELQVTQLPDCSVLLEESTGNINFTGKRIRLFPKGKAKARAIVVDPDFNMSGRGVAEKKWWRN